MGKDKGNGPEVTLPDGKKVPMHNGDRGFFVRHVHTLRVLEGLRYRFRPIRMTDKLEIGRRGMNSFPDKKDVSKHHLTVACVNNHYFLKDAGSRRGSYIKLASSGKNKRVELHKGMTIAVGKIHLKVQSIEGSAADNQAAIEAAAKKKQDAEAAKNNAKDDDLDEDEEYADSDSDDGGSSAGKNVKLEGPPVLFFTSVNKKHQIKGRIRETSTIGSGKEANKIQIKEELAKDGRVDAVHTRICLEDGRFYVEDAGSSFGTFVGFPKKKLVQVFGGDQLLLGSARAQVENFPGKFYFIDGLIDKIMGNLDISHYPVTLLSSSASLEERLQAARGEGNKS